MGLNFSDSSVNFSYSNFGIFRRMLAQEIGVHLSEMDGHGGTRPWNQVNDPIKPLLNHSDCDGDLNADELRQVAPRLRELTMHWPDTDAHGNPEPGAFRNRAQQLADDMERLLADDGDRAVLKFL